MRSLDEELRRIETGEDLSDDENRFKLTLYYNDKESSIITNEKTKNRMVKFLEGKIKNRDSVHLVVEELGCRNKS